MNKPFYSPGEYPRNDSLGWLAHRLRQAVTRHAELRLNEHGLTHAQWKPLLLLHTTGETTVAHLVRELDSDAGATTRLLDRLEAKGLLVRERSAGDRRVVMLKLTPEGRRLSEALVAVLSDVFNTLLDGFTHEEWQLLLKLLQRILATSDAVLAQAAGAPPNEGEKQ